MAETKKYISKIVKAGQTLLVKDAEARASIADLAPKSDLPTLATEADVRSIVTDYNP